METGSDRYARNLELVRLAQSGDEQAFERLIIENTPLVRSIALRFRDRGTELDDLMQIGMIGMVKAVRSFDFDRSTAFSTYAVPLIVGEIKRYLRDDGVIRVSRIYKRTGMMLMRERARINAEEGREPGIAELAALCGVSAEEAAISLEASSPVMSLSDHAYGDDGVTLENVIPDDDAGNSMECIRDKLAISQSLRKLPENQRRIVLLRYFRNKTQQETASALGLTQVRVSREEKKILDFLRKELS